MLGACADLPGSPGPRLVVAHGLLLSVLQWHRQHSDEGGDQGGFPAFFPEAAYVEPIAVSDASLQHWTAHLRAHLQEELDSSEMKYGTGISSEDDRAVLRPPEPVPASLEENESDA
jgi:probable phosphoglycerate mutase